MIRYIKNALRRLRVQRESITAVHDDDLEVFLTSIGSIHDIKAGKIKCKFCRDVISLETLQAVIPESGSINYICNKPLCLQDLMKYTKGRS